MAVGVRGLAQIFSRLPTSLQRAQPRAVPIHQLRPGRAWLWGGTGRRGSFPGDQRSPVMLMPAGTAGMGEGILRSGGRGCPGRAVLIPRRVVHLFSSVSPGISCVPAPRRALGLL